MRGNTLATATLLEVPLVLGRTADGKAFAMRDSCPHRGIPLSYGRFDGTIVECSYHGWRFEACSGQCVEIPSLTSQDKLKVDRVFAGHYPCEERDGYFWVYMNAPGTRQAETTPAAPKLAAMALIDACVRLLPGVIGSAESLCEESFETGLLEYPQYTRPREWNGLAVPDVLLSGDHEKIRTWRRARAEEVTRERRPDLWARYVADRAGGTAPATR